ncbi:MAG: tRNA (guanosine(37)-N1)-methyltransferase TrmD [Candidatus Omnitrophica bacterium]|jgi:tRNA (guanine37-N1)-methyltransferase|nr:tRNA (guanosine(37)-N1)-methyltransferase TrmD [Candidatus Omnitrophota bacterium]
MRIDILSIFPEIFTPLYSSIIKRAQEKNILCLKIWNLRDFATGKHKKTDDQPYGGGKGMVFKCSPIFKGIKKIKQKNPEGWIILTSPQGKLFNQKTAEKLTKKKNIIIICGHYEGIDERVKTIVDEEISIGDYILTGGELPAMVIVDTITRLLPGVLQEESLKHESFTNYLLDWPCWTRPQVYKNMRVPKILLSGDHKKIEQWKIKKSIEITKIKRPDLYRLYSKNAEKPIKES